VREKGDEKKREGEGRRGELMRREGQDLERGEIE
jgi:hypothetical protein